MRSLVVPARWCAVALLAAIAAVLGARLLSIGEGEFLAGSVAVPAAPSPAQSASGRTTPAGAAGRAISPGGSGAVDARAATKRLVEIFATQDRAFRDRDGALLRSVFAPDCPCLRAGLERVGQLRRDRLRWVGYRSRVSDVRARPTAAGSWTVRAVVRGSRTRVETESRELLRIIPPARLRWTFVLTEPPGGGPLLLSEAEAAP